MVLDLLNTYPEPVSKKLYFLRSLIFQSASALPDKDILEETLKWGEPAYTTKFGSTIRINRIKENPDEYAIFFHCKTKLVDTFKEFYKDTFIFDGNRAILFNKNDAVPVEELKHCITLSLTYHKRKKLPLLGI